MFGIEGFAQWIITLAGVITAIGIILKWFRPKLKSWLGLTLPEDVLAALQTKLDTVIDNQNVINENVLAVQNKPEEAELAPEVAAAWETILGQMHKAGE